VVQRREYRVLVSRFRGWWYIEVPALGVLTESDNFTEAEASARSSIAQLLGDEIDSFDVAIELRSAEQLSASKHWLTPAG
jgi:hypothetical protein